MSNEDRRSCLNTRRIKYVYIAGTKGACHAAYDWYWLAVHAGQMGRAQTIQREGAEGPASVAEPAEAPETVLPKGSDADL